MGIGLAALRLLVIDDNAQMRLIVGSALSAAGVRRLRYASDGRQGLHLVTEFRPDVCYVDYEMPNLNGLEFISRVRSLGEPLRYMPIIVLTGHSDVSRLNAARDRGATEFLCKPITARTILTRLESVINRPRPFIETEDFFGPDRRRRMEPSYTGPRRRRTDDPEVVEL